MKNIPIFTTENGTASLTLKEIPYTGRAYVRIQGSQEPQALTEECISFCRSAGAEEIYCAGHPYLRDTYPLHTAIWQMQCEKEDLEGTDAALFPVQPETAETWREIYNQKMIAVANATWIAKDDLKSLLVCSQGYFVHRGKELLGIGLVSYGSIDAVASVKPGCGKDLMLALAHAVSEDSITLEVASVNERALHLYEELGFVKTREISRWYKIF